MRKKSVLNICLLFCSLILLAGCNDSFDPIQENDKYYFSIYGYLDTSADTQWVRVSPARQTIDELPNPSGIQVKLEDLQSGESVVMNDSISTSRNVLNYWTTMPVENEQTYRISVKDVDVEEKVSHVTVSTPKEMASIYIITNNVTPIGASIYLDDSIENIADLQSVWYVILNPETERLRRIYRFPLRNTLRNSGFFLGDSYTFANWTEEREQIEQSVGNAEISVVARQFFVATGGPEWDNNLTSIEDLEYFLVGTATNVENGLGYVVGVDTKWFWQAPCLTTDESNYAPCEPVEPFRW